MNEFNSKLNKTDRYILDILQKEGRLSFAEIARRVGLSTTPCIERIKKLERDGVITGYSAQLNPRKVGAELLVFVQIRLSRTSQVIFDEFKEAVLGLSQVQECHLVSGNFDYLIKARVANMDAYRAFLGETLLTLPGVQESTSYVVMEAVKETHVIAI